MSRRTTGVVFCFIAALLYATHYLAAAIFGSGVSTWNNDLFRVMLEYVGPGLPTWATIALVVGIAYLIWGEIVGRRRISNE
jgi:putative Ca2+/H+ antiporter (TMEM165/GDT1 family)